MALAGHQSMAMPTVVVTKHEFRIVSLGDLLRLQLMFSSPCVSCNGLNRQSSVVSCVGGYRGKKRTEEKERLREEERERKKAGMSEAYRHKRLIE
ncbi:hypothetical protein ElyMa_001428300 [Elysia marginata]|uniref:Uncharacterized protein n=1 Tax=Elysia marginata TaxID=1093978 RepID=A0AAV4IVM2_9GAST|nr:hypothetical protein ElyMa_001428300 [Elysia marginata]